MRRAVLLIVSVAACLAQSTLPQFRGVWSAGQRCCTYYVDSASADDAGNGRTPATAKKTIAAVNALTLTPGQSVGFKRGGTWRETLIVPSSGSTSAPVVFGAYGVGANPIISGSDLITAGWSQQAANVWKATVSTQPKIIYINGILGVPVASIGAVAAELNWYWASNVLYVWSPPDSDPSAYYTSPGIEAGARNRAIQTNNQTNLTFSGLTFRDGNGSPSNANFVVGFNVADGIVIDSCVIERGVQMGIWVSAGTTAGSVIVKNSTIRNNGADGMLICDGCSLKFTSGLISNNTWYGNMWRSVIDNVWYSNLTGTFDNIEIVGNLIKDSPPAGTCKTDNQHCHGIYTQPSAATAKIHGNTIYNQFAGGGIKAMSSADIYDNNIYNNACYGVYSTTTGGSYNAVVNVFRNLIYSNNRSLSGCDGFTENAIGSGTLAISLQQNTFYQNSNTNNYEINISDPIQNLVVKNNVIVPTATRRAFQSVVAQTSPVIDYNLQWRTDGNPHDTYNGAYDLDWTAWKALGFDAHGVNADPLFVNITNGDFNLQSGSPAINAGTYISSVSPTNPISIGVPVAPDPDKATLYTISGPTFGTVGSPSSNFTITPNGRYTGTVTITPSGGGISTPIVLTFANSLVPQTFTITPATTGTITLTASNSGTLADWASLTYNLSCTPASGYAHCRAISTDNTQAGTADSTNFPLLVSTTLGSSRIQNASCYDVVFTSDLAGTTKVPWEMESCTQSTGAITAWVLLSRLHHATPDSLYVSYGNSGVSTAQNTGAVAPTNVWNDGSFQGVYHLGGSLVANSTSVSGLTATNSGVTSQTGQIAGGGSFTNTSTDTIANNAALKPTGAFTVSAWINPTTIPANGVNRQIALADAAAGWTFRIRGTSTGSSLSFLTGGGGSNGNGNNITQNAWQYVVGTWNGSITSGSWGFYVNNVSIGVTGSGGTAPAYSTGTVVIGSNGANSIEGIDEFRLATGVRSASWITSEYNNQKSGSTFVSVGSEI